MLEQIQKSYEQENVLYTRHARDEMELEEFGEVKENEVSEAIKTGRIIEDYPNDKPHPSCLIYGKTVIGRPLHIVCAYSEEDEMTIIVTVYHPDPEKWVDNERRKQ